MDSLLAALPPASAAKESPAGHYVIEVSGTVDPLLLAAVTTWCAAHPRPPPPPRPGPNRPGSPRPELTLTPAPGAAPLGRMIAAQARLETRTLLRNGEQLGLTLVIPLLLLAAFSLEPLVNFGAGMSRVDFLTPGIIALAVMSTAFTSQARSEE